ncbi:MAG: hypothetical protein J3R72DRAFT_440800 [Linnemannia gamsii]|nr:MAG: hypothetical protein J3R72DRAFT_440800 [Linnemannia gamsii]
MSLSSSFFIRKNSIVFAVATSLALLAFLNSSAMIVQAAPTSDSTIATEGLSTTDKRVDPVMNPRADALSSPRSAQPDNWRPHK